VAREARATGVAVAEALDYQGVLCVELFLLEDGRLLVNEIAPRPHNSGHYTIDACYTSQFEQQVRVLCGLPLGDAAMHGPAVMVNLLGELWRAGDPDWTPVLASPRAKLHLYGKREARPGRKMGHFTVLAADPQAALAEALAIRGRLRAAAGLEPV
jgi:5-(carboxyamino)imidazole ribonucleotide synthase